MGFFTGQLCCLLKYFINFFVFSLKSFDFSSFRVVTLCVKSADTVFLNVQYVLHLCVPMVSKGQTDTFMYTDLYTTEMPHCGTMKLRRYAGEGQRETYLVQVQLATRFGVQVQVALALKGKTIF